MHVSVACRTATAAPFPAVGGSWYMGLSFMNCALALHDAKSDSAARVMCPSSASMVATQRCLARRELPSPVRPRPVW